MTGLKAAIWASILTAPACLASVRDGMPPLPPLPSPDGQYLLSPDTTLDSEGVTIWAIRITDTSGRIEMSALGPDFSWTRGLYRAWDGTGRAWIYSDSAGDVWCYDLTPSGWHEVYWNDDGTVVDGFDAPYDLYPPVTWERRSDPQEMMPECLVENSGPGWEYTLYLPEIQADHSFLRRLVSGIVWPKIDWFISSAESSFAESGCDPGFMDWSLDISMSLPQVPEGMLAVACDWWDYTGGVHGNGDSDFWLFEYDEESIGSLPWVMIGAEDLLADSAELVALSALVVDRLAESLGEFSDMDWIMRGAGPSWSNYGDLMPVPDSTGALAGFGICFPDYRVAPYVAGPQYVYIPIELLRPPER